MKRLWQWFRAQHWVHNDEVIDEKTVTVRCKTCGRVDSLMWAGLFW